MAKDLIFDNGGRPYKNDDFNTLQATARQRTEADKLDNGNYVLSGCQFAGSEANYSISTGWVFIDGQIFEFDGGSSLSGTNYIQIGSAVESDIRLHEQGGSKATKTETKAEVVVADPGGQRIQFSFNTIRRYIDVLGANVLLLAGTQTVTGKKTFTSDLNVNATLRVNGAPVVLNNKADKTITITGTDGLAGGGDLSQNRTLSIADGGVTTGKIANAAVTADKLNDTYISTTTNTTVNTTTTTRWGQSSTYLQLSATNTNPIIQHSGTLLIQNQTGENAVRITATPGVELYHNNVKRIETTSQGISVSDDIQVNGTLNLNAQNNVVKYRREDCFVSGAIGGNFTLETNFSVVVSFGFIKTMYFQVQCTTNITPTMTGSQRRIGTLISALRSISIDDVGPNAPIQQLPYFVAVHFPGTGAGGATRNTVQINLDMNGSLQVEPETTIPNGTDLIATVTYI